MKKIKRFALSALALILAAGLASCAGIGDGALYGRDDTDKPAENNTSPAITSPEMPRADNGYEPVQTWSDCHVETYDKNGKLVMRSVCDRATEDILRELIENGNYEIVFKDYLKIPEHIQVRFPERDGESAVSYIVYADDYLPKKNGLLKGAYEKICSLAGIDIVPADAEGTAYTATVKFLGNGDKLYCYNIFEGNEGKELYLLMTEKTELDTSADMMITADYIRVDLEVRIPGEAVRNELYLVYSSGLVRRVYPGAEEIDYPMGVNNNIYGELKDILYSSLEG